MKRRQWPIVGAAVMLLTLGWFVFVIRDRAITGFYRGYYTTGVATQAFRACGDREVWWVTSLEHEDSLRIAHAQRNALIAPAGETVTLYVEWHGTRSARRRAATTPSAVGDADADLYARHFTVEQILTARRPGPDDCP